MTPRVSNRFEDPSGTLGVYNWHINHNEEQGSSKARAIEHTANTGLTGLVRQQGAETPFVMQLKGTILQEVQHVKFLQFFEACSSRTIRYYDFNGDGYEVLITRYDHPRRRTVRNPRDPVDAPMHVWDYTLEMEVITFLSGPYAAAGVSP